MRKLSFLGLCLVSCILSLALGCGQSGTPTTTSTTVTTTTTSPTTTSVSETTTSTDTTSTSSTSNTSTSTSSTTSTTAYSGTATIRGSLSAGTIASSSIRATGLRIQATAYSAIEDYNLAAVSKNTGDVFFADTKTDSAGNFTISNLPADSYYIAVLNSDDQLIAPVTFGQAESKPVMAITPSSSEVNLGNIAYDSSKSTAAPTLEPTPMLDLNTSVEAKSGETLVPIGAGNYGKGSETEYAGSYNIAVADGDKDGLPNYFDADNNGDLIVDEFDGMSTKETTSSSEGKTRYLAVFTNLKVDYGYTNTFKPAYTQFRITIELYPQDGHSISRAYCTEGPAWIDTASLEGSATLWKNTSPAYTLSDAGTKFNVVLQGVRPTFEVNAGDCLKFKVEFSDGSSEEVVKMLNFVFTDIPHLVAYKFGHSGSWQTPPTPSGSDSPIGAMTSSEAYLIWSRPKDESGNAIIGARYTTEYDSYGHPPLGEFTMINFDDGTSTSLEADPSYAGLIVTTGEVGFTICARDNANDNCSQNYRFNRSGW